MPLSDGRWISWRYLLDSYFGLRYWLISRGDLDHAMLAGDLASPEERDRVVNQRMAAAGIWRWRWQRKDGSMRWSRG